ncbi:MAG: hypothetical protein HY077_17320 [Elusimicrobia bacterium]|nr:hypothetical protein [Elusimicrobiota bacterium]
MHRTQVLLEERQFAALKARARREAKGLSELIRLAVDRLLGGGTETSGKKSGLRSICGIGRAVSGPSGADHDEAIYGEPL